MASCKYCNAGSSVNRDGEGRTFRWELTGQGWRLYDPISRSYHLCRKRKTSKTTVKVAEITSHPF